MTTDPNATANPDAQPGCLQRVVRPVEWRDFNAECPYCGCRAEVLTDTGKDNWAVDGDEARCAECHCPGSVVVSEEPLAEISWHDDPACDCEWCKTHPA